jgi:polyether ionophore transport system permease protein
VLAVSAVGRRNLADTRVRNGAFALFLALYAFVQAVGYRHAYPTLADRLQFAKAFGANKTLQLFYGVPHDLTTVGGYTAWRGGGIGSIVAAFWGLLAAVRATRAEEDSGRQELVLAGVVGRRGAYLAALLAIAAGAVALWLAFFVGLVAGRLAVGGSAYLALATVVTIAVFAGVGMVASQVASSRRVALELGGIVLAVAFLLRVIADLSTGLGWLRWATPLGWSEELRAFAGPRPWVLVLPAVTSLGLLVLAGRIALRRDVGRGLITGRDSRPPRLRLLSSPTALALRSELGSVSGWLAGTAAYALVIGLLSTSFSASNIPASLREQLAKLGASLTTPSGALGVYFLFFVFAVSIFCCAQVGAARHEEAEERLETLFASAVGRTRWLGGRLLLAAGGAAAIAATVALVAWAGAASQNADVSLLRMLEAGLNCLPIALLFLGLATLAFALLPRASVGLSYALVSVAFVWQLVASVLGVPRWVRELTPFAHVGLVPAQSFRPGAALLMLALAVSTTGVGLWAFRRRDLQVA